MFIAWSDLDLLQLLVLYICIHSAFILSCCILYSAFVMPLFDYCDVVWPPSTAKLNYLTERIHSKFINKLPLTYHSINFLLP